MVKGDRRAGLCVDEVFVKDRPKEMSNYYMYFFYTVVEKTGGAALQTNKYHNSV